jgi:ParB-like chromosome segregation protein Spo0J
MEEKHLFHEVTNLFPPMEEAEYASLKADISQHGLREALWVYQSQIIDGRHRDRACKELGIPPTYREWDGQGSLVSFVVSLNLFRRHLSSSQKAMVALAVEEQLGVEAKQRQRDQGERGKEGGKGHRKPRETLGPNVAQGFGRSAQQAGALVGVGKTYVKQAKEIVAQAPELQEVVLSGVLDLSAAKLVAPLPDEQRGEVVRRVKTGEAKNAKAAILELKKAAVEAQAQASPSKPPLTFASWKTWLPEQPPCDLLLTDPPYSTDLTEIEGFAQAWLPLALSKVRPTGRAYVCIGAYPEELRAYLQVPVPSHLRLLNVLVWTYRNTLGPSPTQGYKLNWQAILHFVGVEAPPLDCPVMTEQFSVQDINAPDGRLGNRYHPWQKPDELAERLIRHSTRPGNTVLDCFAGTGTFLLAAHRLGRQALGCDYSEAMLSLAEKRGCQIVSSV